MTARQPRPHPPVIRRWIGEPSPEAVAKAVWLTLNWERVKAARKETKPQ